MRAIFCAWWAKSCKLFKNNINKKTLERAKWCLLLAIMRTTLRVSDKYITSDSSFLTSGNSIRDTHVAQWRIPPDVYNGNGKKVHGIGASTDTQRWLHSHGAGKFLGWRAPTMTAIGNENITILLGCDTTSQNSIRLGLYFKFAGCGLNHQLLARAFVVMEIPAVKWGVMRITTLTARGRGKRSGSQGNVGSAKFCQK